MGDDDALKFTMLLLPLLIWVVCTTTNASQDFEQCENAVKGWASSSLPLHVKDDEHILQHFLFFLHVPRTGGRTYLFCFLKKLYKSLECAHSYDKLRFDPSKPNCRLLASHDDYSMMTKLPKAETSVVTIVRNPIDRIFSSYEFSIEVASRYMVHPNLASVTRMARSNASNTTQTRTLDIWPWKYLVPWMREDLFARRESRKNKVSTNIKSNDSYNMKDVLMPLLDYIRHPLALDLIHNGATFQIAGLTNNSNLEESHKVRHCVLKYLILGEYVLEVAKKRLDNMLYVGLTEKHKESATMFADVVGLQVISQLMEASNSSTNIVANNGSAQSISTFSNSESEPSLHSNSTLNQMVNRISFTGKVEATKENPIVKELTKVYETCASDAHESQTRGHNVSLDNISVDFTKEGRSHVPDLVLQEIASLNSLDLQLYKHAQDIFAKQRRNVLQKVVGSETENKLRYLLDVVTWKFILLTTIALLLFCVVLVIKARRRRSKLKE